MVKVVAVPVDSRSLSLKVDNRTYRPVFFRKEDLEKSLFRASKNQQRLNPVFRQGDIEFANYSFLFTFPYFSKVAVLEEIVRGMKDKSSTKWNDVVFVPPGFDVSTDLSPK
ncbi:hypothetical protein KSS87_021529 [Heliosperma pusillum]|nr:hypothetical protein KSS87_021529 [Heliosperma pusillum]